MVNLGDGGVETVFKSFGKTFDDAAFFLQRADTLQMQLSGNNTNNHKIRLLGRLLNVCYTHYIKFGAEIQEKVICD